MTRMAPPGSFVAACEVNLPINFNDPDDDYRRVRAEHWCCLYSRGRWLRSIPRDMAVARFAFEDGHDAVLFKLHHG